MDLTIQCEKLPQSGETVEGHDFLTNPGGKGGNQAVAAAKLGALTYMVGRVGRDHFGDDLLRSLAAYGVDCTYVSRSETLNTGIAIITRSGGDNRIILSSGANHEMDAGDVEAILKQLSEPGDIFTTQYECDPVTVLDALSLAKQRGLFTLFNPAPAREIPPQSYPSIDLIVVNQTECEFLTGIYPEGPSSCQAPLRKFLEFGASAAIITLGAQGSVYGSGDETIVARSYRTPNVDTTAAGDTYIGALACSMASGHTIAEGMTFASKAAALTITKRGAQQSIPTLKELEEYFRDR